MFRTTRLLLTLAVAGLLASATHAQVGPPGGTIYAHDVAYGVVATPRDLPPQGQFDQIYVLGEELASVAESAPGDPDYNGGRWEVHMVEFLTIPPTQFTNAEDVLAAAGRGEVRIGEVARRFECPLIPKRGRGPR